MNPFTLNLLLSLLRAAPQIATDIEAAVKAAESDEEKASKVKDVLTDLGKALDAILSVL